MEWYFRRLFPEYSDFYCRICKFKFYSTELYTGTDPADWSYSVYCSIRSKQK